MCRQLALAVTIASSGLVFSAAGQQPPAQEAPDAAAMFAALDTNKDGQLSADEVPAEQKRLFERLVRIADKNKDGQLNAEEFAEGLKPRERPASAAGGGPDGRPGPERLFKRLDANGDGKVTLDEVPEERREGFKQLIVRGDKDGDGALNEQEFVAALTGPPTPPAKPAEPKRPEGRPDPKELFSRLDQNSDGKVTLDEVPEERRDGFERLIEIGDKDGDGALNEQEFVKAFASLPGGGARPEAAKGPEAAGRAKQIFSRLDKNGDGKLTLDEVPEERQGIRRLIARGDKDGDKALSLEEFIAVFPQGPPGQARPKNKGPKAS